MRNPRLAVGLVAFGAVVTLAFTYSRAQDAASSYTPQTRIAVCDIKEILANFPKAKDLFADLQKRRTEIEMEDKKRRDALENIEGELAQLKRGGTEWERRFAEMQRLGIDREVWIKHQNGMMMHEHHKITRALYEEVVQAAGKVARDRGYHLVLSYDRNMPETANSQELGAVLETRSVIWTDSQVDITEDVLKQIKSAN